MKIHSFLSKLIIIFGLGIFSGCSSFGVLVRDLKTPNIPSQFEIVLYPEYLDKAQGGFNQHQGWIMKAKNGNKFIKMALLAYNIPKDAKYNIDVNNLVLITKGGKKILPSLAQPWVANNRTVVKNSSTASATVPLIIEISLNQTFDTEWDKHRPNEFIFLFYEFELSDPPVKYQWFDEFPQDLIIIKS
jgi:hypothetical protein